MYKDPTAFRERFKQYKEGKKPYEAGLPRYKGGNVPLENTDQEWDDSKVMDYILAIENPGRVGFKGGIWRPPTDSSLYDIHSIGGGLDIREENNPIVYNFLKEKGRLNNPWLSEKEELELRNRTWQQKKRDVQQFAKKHGLSERGYITAAGMRWQGHPYAMLKNKNSITGAAFLDSLANGDKDMIKAFDTYYGYGTNAKRYKNRVLNSNKWFSSYVPTKKVSFAQPMIASMMDKAPRWDPPAIPQTSKDGPTLAPTYIRRFANTEHPLYTIPLSNPIELYNQFWEDNPLSKPVW